MLCLYASTNVKAELNPKENKGKNEKQMTKTTDEICTFNPETFTTVHFFCH